MLFSCAAAAQPSPLMQQYNRAWELSGQLKPDEAIPILKGIIAEDKTFSRAYRGLANAYLAKKEPGPLREYFQSLIAQDGANPLPYYGLALLDDAALHFVEESRNYIECVKRGRRVAACYPGILYPYPLSRLSNQLAREFEKLIPADPKDPFRYLGLTTLFCSRSKRDQMCQAADRGLAAAGNAGQNDLRFALTSLAITCASSGDAKISQALRLQEIAKGIGSWEDAVESEKDVAGSYADAGKFDVARSLMESRIEEIHGSGNRRAEVSLMGSLVNLYRFHGDLDAAIDLDWKAWKLQDDIGDSVGRLNTLYTIEKMYREQGRLTEALQLLGDLTAQAARLDYRPYQAYVLTDTGYVYAEMGDYFKAIQFERQSVAIFESLGMHSQVGAGLGMLAIHYSSLGDYTTALEYYRRSLASAHRFQNHEEVKRNLLYLGDTYLRMDRPRDALAALRESLVIHSDFPWFQSRVLVNMGRTYLRLGQYQSARRRFEQAVAEAHSLGSGRYEGEALVGLGEVYLQGGQTEKAREFFSRALELGEKDGLTNLIVEARRGLAQTEAREKNYAEARRQFALAIDKVESVRALVPDPDLRTGLAPQNGSLYEEMVDALYSLHRQDPSHGYDYEAFDYAERGRARTFLETFSAARARVTRGLTVEQSRAEEKLSAAVSRASGDRSLNAAEAALATWRKETRAANPHYEDLQDARVFTARDAQAEISRPGVDILEYALGEKRSFLWIMSASRLTIAELPGRRAIEAAVTAYRRVISQAPQAGDPADAGQPQARLLYQMLVEPAQPLLKPDHRLLVVPDGILYYLPFETLLSTQTGRYLVEDFAVTYAPSVSAFGSLGRSVSQRPKKELLAFGDPVFTRGARAAGAPAATVRSVYERGGWSLAPLPNTRREVEAIGKLYPIGQEKTYLGSYATEAAVKREKLTDYKRIHFATHAVVDERHPARSGIVLSLGDASGEDGVLRMPEIFNLEMDADLVVLSACQTGLGKLVRGEGMVGLTRAFLYAGARRVAVSLWEVNDLATADFMKSFYEGMKSGTPAAALRAAKLGMIHSPSPAYRHPSYWAPFILTGPF